MNRKHKKLKFIREKNAIRAGKEVKTFFKLSKKTIQDEEMCRNQLEIQEYFQLKLLKNKYNLDFSLNSFDSGYDNDDFIKGLMTIIMNFQIKPI